MKQIDIAPPKWKKRLVLVEMTQKKNEYVVDATNGVVYLPRMKNPTAFLLSLLFIIPSLGYASSREWYVRPAGGDYGIADGTSYENAWDGFSKILWGKDGVEAGDTLYVCGEHSEELTVGKSGTREEIITIRGDCKDNPAVITGEHSTGVRFDRKNYLRFFNISFKDSKTGMASYGGCNTVIIDRCRFLNHSLKGLHLYSRDPNYYVEDITVKRSEFVNIGQWGNTGANSVTFARQSRNTIVEDCIFSGNGKDKGVDGILIQNIHGDGSNHVIRRNRFSGHEENAIDLKHVVQSALNEGTTRIYDNYLTSSNQLEIVIHWGTQGVHIFRNRFEGGRVAIGLVKHKRVNNRNGKILIAYNLFYDFSKAVLMDGHKGGLGNNRFLNNTCYNIGFDNKDTYSIQIATHSWVIKNNIFSRLSQGKSPFSAIRFLPGIDMATIELDSNCLLLYKGSKAYRWPDNSYRTVLEAENKGVVGDPQFVDALAGDFNVKSTSPCIRKGAVIVDLPTETDVQGRLLPRELPPTIGAFEMPQVQE